MNLTAEIKEGSRVIVTDILDEDAFYSVRHEIIGRTGTITRIIRGYGTGLHRQVLTRGSKSLKSYMSCQISFDITTDSSLTYPSIKPTSRRTTMHFFAVKVENINGMSENEVKNLRFILLL